MDTVVESAYFDRLLALCDEAVGMERFEQARPNLLNELVRARRAATTEDTGTRQANALA